MSLIRIITTLVIFPCTVPSDKPDTPYDALLTEDERKSLFTALTASFGKDSMKKLYSLATETLKNSESARTNRLLPRDKSELWFINLTANALFFFVVKFSRFGSSETGKQMIATMYDLAQFDSGQGDFGYGVTDLPADSEVQVNEIQQTISLDQNGIRARQEAENRVIQNIKSRILVFQKQFLEMCKPIQFVPVNLK